MAEEVNPNTDDAAVVGGPRSQVPGLPITPQTISLVDFDFSLGDLPPDLLNSITNIPFFHLAQDEYGTYIQFISPSVAGYSLRADIRADFNIDVDLNYFIDLGKLDFQAHGVSALSLFDDDPQSVTPKPHDPDADVYTNLVIDTSRARLNLDSHSIAPQEDSFAQIAVDVHGNLGVVNAGVYDGNIKEWDLGNPFGFSGGYGGAYDLFRGRPGDNLASFDNGPFRGFANVPSLPSDLAVSSGGTGSGVYTTGSDEADGPIFANLTFDPIPLIPVLGQVNSGSFYPLQSYLLDAGVEWKIITADFGANLNLRQSLDVSITSVGVEIDVNEQNHDENDRAYYGQYGDVFELIFTPGDQEDTLITEKYTINAHVHTDISLIPSLSLDLRLLDFAMIINPILVDEFRAAFNLFNHRFEFDIASFNLVSDGFDITFEAVEIVTQIDTHVPVEGTPFNDNGVPYPDGTVYPRLDLAGNQSFIDGLAGDDIIVAQDIDSILNGGADDDHIEGGAGADLIHGGSGMDSIFGFEGDDVIYSDGGPGPGTVPGQREYILAGTGKDTVFVEDSRAYVDGGNDNDTISIKIRTPGNQEILGGDGFDILNLDFSTYGHLIQIDLSQHADQFVLVERPHAEDNSYFSGFERVNVLGTRFADDIFGDGADQEINGGRGDDLLRGGSGDDVLLGEDGHDLIDGEAGDDEIHGGEGIDEIDGGIADDVIFGDDGDDIIIGGSGKDAIFGGNGGDDIIDNGVDDGEADNLFGQDGDDRLSAGGGGDKLYGGAGDDTLLDRGGEAQLFGGDGQDIFLLTGASHVYGGAGSDTYRLGFFAIPGYDDGAYTSGAEIHDDDAREDPSAIFGANSDDKIVAVGVTSAVHDLPEDYEFADYAPDVFEGEGTLVNPDGSLSATYSGIDSFDLTGTDAADHWLTGRSPYGGGDVMRGLGGDDFLDGSDQGADQLYGGEGDDVLVGDLQDLIDGGAGEDTLFWRSSRLNQYISLGDSEHGSQTGTGPQGKAIIGVERLVMLDGSIGQDSIYGGIGDDSLIGDDGDDILSGNAGNDVLYAGEGGDTVSGGAGQDYIDATDFQIVPDDELESVRVVPVPGEIFPNIIIDHIRYDTIDGGAGDDFILASNTASSIKGGGGDDIVVIQDGGFRGDVVSVIDGGWGNDALNGSAEAEIFYGGPDLGGVTLPVGRVVIALADQDLVHGGGGDDLIYGGDDDDYLEGGEGTDEVHGDDGDDSLHGSGADSLYGGDDDDLLVRDGVGPGPVAAAPPVLLLDGGMGDDIARFDYTGSRMPISFVLDHDVMATSDLHLVGIDAIQATLSDFDDEVTGGALDDVIYGGEGLDILRGAGGDDLLDTGLTTHGLDPVRDLLFGGAGDDTLVVHDMADADGGADDDYLTVNGHNEWFDGVRLLVGEDGAFGPDDQLRYRNVEHLIYSASMFGPAVDVTGGENRDILSGGESGDRLDGGGGDDELYGGGGDDVLSVSQVETQARLNGGMGTDLAIIDLSDHDEGVEVSIGLGGGGPPRGPGGPGVGGGEGEGGGSGPSPYATPVSLFGIERLDVTTGRGADHVVGGFLNDVIDTGGGDDIVDSAGGSDTVDLGAGDDSLVDKGMGVDLFYGGDGDDSFDLGSQKATVYGGAGDDVVTITEFFYGLPQLDTPDTIDLGAGDDRLTTNSLGVFTGGEGIDRITTNLSKGGALNLDLTSRDPIVIGANWSLEDFEEYHLTFGEGADRVTVDYGLHNLDGGGGVDRLTLRLTEPVSYSTDTDGFGGTVYHFANGMVVRGFEQVDLVYSALNLHGGPGPDALTGGALDDRLYGGGGDDVLTGLGGDDLLAGGAGNDKLYGGAGQDMADYSDAPIGVRVNLALTGAQDTGHGKDQLSGIEDLTGSDFADSLAGDGSRNSLYGGGGADSLSGGGGDDKLYGGAGADTLNGGAGADRMAGGADNDIYVVDDAGDSVVENVDEGADRVSASVSFVLGANIETLVLTGVGDLDGTGNDQANSLTGNAGANQMSGEGGDDVLNGGAGDDRLFGGAGADALNGGAGIDQMTGGAGADSYTVDDAGDRVFENPDEGADRVSASVSFILSANVETLVLTGTADISGTGNDLANSLIGNAGANILYGMDGDDSLSGGAGEDSLYGGAGADILNGGSGGDMMAGGAGSDSYTVDHAFDTVTENPDEGQDRVSASVGFVLGANIESLVLTGTADIDGTGNDLANAISGNAGANHLYGMDGDDQLSGYDGDDQLYGGMGADILNGGGGADMMAGGAGSDSYVVDHAGDTVTENPDEGSDRVSAGVSFVLGANIEALTLTGTADTDGTGNGMANTVTGNAGANHLYGMDGDDQLNGNDGADQLFGGQGVDRLIGGNGDDLLVGGLGADALSGGLGADTFRFDLLETSANRDAIADFVSGQDRVELALAAFTGLAGFGLGALDPGELTFGAAATTTAQRLIYNAANGALYYDADGAGGVAQVQVALFSTRPSLAASDFILV